MEDRMDAQLKKALDSEDRILAQLKISLESSVNSMCRNDGARRMLRRSTEEEIDGVSPRGVAILQKTLKSCEKFIAQGLNAIQFNTEYTRDENEDEDEDDGQSMEYEGDGDGVQWHQLMIEFLKTSPSLRTLKIHSSFFHDKNKKRHLSKNELISMSGAFLRAAFDRPQIESLACHGIMAPVALFTVCSNDRRA